MTDTELLPAAGCCRIDLSSPWRRESTRDTRPPGTGAAGTPVALPASPVTPEAAVPGPGVGSAAGAGSIPADPTPAGPAALSRRALTAPRPDAGRRIPHGARRRFHPLSRLEVTGVGR